MTLLPAPAGPKKCPRHSGAQYHHPAHHPLSGEHRDFSPNPDRTLWTCLRITWEEKGAHTHPDFSSSSSLVFFAFFKPLEATSLWPAQTLGLVTLAHSSFLEGLMLPAELQRPQSHPMLGGCLEAVLKLEWSSNGGGMFGNWSSKQLEERTSVHIGKLRLLKQQMLMWGCLLGGEARPSLGEAARPPSWGLMF